MCPTATPRCPVPSTPDPPTFAVFNSYVSYGALRTGEFSTCQRAICGRSTPHLHLKKLHN